MRKYYDNAIIVDAILTFVTGAILYFCKPIIKSYLNIPTMETINNFSVSLITLSATLIGFFLTIVTVIVTFKQGFENQTTIDQSINRDDVPVKTVFDVKISKETKFYNSNIHKNVVNVFVCATYEIALTLLSLLLIQFNLCSFSIFWNSLITICLFIPIILSTIRCLYVFQLFLNVHLHNKSIEK